MERKDAGRIIPYRPGRRGAAAWLPAACAAIRAGGIVAIPTETFYGLAVDPRQEAAVSRLLALKGYPPGRAVLLLGASAAQAAALCSMPPGSTGARLAAAFWPGPLTLVLPVRGGRRIPACPDGTAAIRVPAAPAARELAAAHGFPLTGTSANPAGVAPARTAAAACAFFPADLALAVDGGSAPGDLPSTILDLCGPLPVLRRTGCVPAAAIVQEVGPISEAGPAGAPG